MVATGTRPRDDDTELHNRGGKRHCCRDALSLTCNAGLQGDAAADFVRQFNLQSACGVSREQPVTQLAWRCFSEFNVRSTLDFTAG